MVSVCLLPFLNGSDGSVSVWVKRLRLKVNDKEFVFNVRIDQTKY